MGERLHKVLGQIDLCTLDSGERSLPFGLLVLLQISSELKILEHNVKKRIVSSASISSNLASMAKNVQILNMSRFAIFGDKTFRGHICKIRLAEINRT